MNGMTVRFECGGAILVPFQEQCPQIRVIFAEKTELVYTLIVTEPTPPLALVV